MSHLKERLEKDCLNCGTIVQGRFCQQCGQENIEVKESFVQLLIHFVEDLTHFDGKLWKTLKLLLFKPGKLTQLYMDGKRASYIHPIRMYLFISAVFFLFMFTGDVPDKPKDLPNNAKPPKDIATSFNNGFGIDLGNDTVKYRTIEEYEFAQEKLPESKKDDWFESILLKKSIELNEKYEGDKFKIGKALIVKFEHYFSRMFYISLPLFALFLWLLYRKSKNHYFVDHLIFSIHIYCSFFIFLFVVKVINVNLELFLHKKFSFIGFLTPLGLIFYLYKALKNNFNQTFLKTLVKLLILSILTLLLLSTLMVLFFLFSLLNL